MRYISVGFRYRNKLFNNVYMILCSQYIQNGLHAVPQLFLKVLEEYNNYLRLLLKILIKK